MVRVVGRESLAGARLPAQLALPIGRRRRREARVRQATLPLAVHFQRRRFLCLLQGRAGEGVGLLATSRAALQATSTTGPLPP